MDALERTCQLDGVAPDNPLGDVHVLRLEPSVAAERRWAGYKVLVEERVRGRVVVVSKDDRCRMTTTFKVGRLVERPDLERAEGGERTAVTKSPRRKSLPHTHNVGMDDPPPTLDRAKRLVVHNLEPFNSAQAVEAAIDRRARAERLGPQTAKRALVAGRPTVDALGLVRFERVERVVDVQGARERGYRYRRRLERGVRPRGERLVC